MKVCLIQTSLSWEAPPENRANFERLMTGHKDPDIIVLPEMFSTGFTMNPAPVAETMDGETVAWMKRIAAEKNAAVTGSLVIKENGKYYNRLLFVTPACKIETYDKRHLFSLAGEDKAYTAGTKKLIIDYKGWKICPLICYDLRFPVFSRNTEEYDLLLYVANWPEPRIHAWKTLLRARAIENMCYVVGANRIGEDQNGHSYTGQSKMLDVLGKNLNEPSDQEEVISLTLDRELLLFARKKFGFLNDRDQFTLEL
jgi:predicted amidohydrolase